MPSSHSRYNALKFAELFCIWEIWIFTTHNWLFFWFLCVLWRHLFATWRQNLEGLYRTKCSCCTIYDASLLSHLNSCEKFQRIKFLGQIDPGGLEKPLFNLIELHVRHLCKFCDEGIFWMCFSWFIENQINSVVRYPSNGFCLDKRMWTFILREKMQGTFFNMAVQLEWARVWCLALSIFVGVLLSSALWTYI